MSRTSREIMGHQEYVLSQLLNVTSISQWPAVDVITRSMLQEYEHQKGVYEHENLAGLKAEGGRRRSEFLEEARLQPPRQLRLIDCNSTCLENQVVLVDWADQQQVDYTAISHTYGMEVYDVFNCICTSKCLAKVPRCSDKPCTKHLDPSDPRNRVVQDILGMCAILRAAGVQYAWHDGVCIAQHNVAEVEETIKHVGWIYASAKETLVFLHYVGSPMALIRHDGDLESRWQTRVWTFQEAAVSKCRRYCVRVGMGGEYFGDCQSLQEFEEKVSLWYRAECSQVAVIDEEVLWKVIMEVYSVLVRLLPAVSASEQDPILLWKAIKWIVCISGWVRTLFYTCFQFPTVATALEFCSLRDSKHVGDRINSIVAVAGVKDFVAPKDINMEASTIEFFKRQGQQGLARAVFTTNVLLRSNSRDGAQPSHHTWVPSLSNPLKSIYEQIRETVVGDERQLVTSSCVENLVGFRVLQDGKLELTGELACVAVKFTARARNPVQDPVDAEGVQGSIMVVQVERPSYYPVYLAMYVTPDTVGFTASLAQASTLEFGTAVVPIAGREPESSITEIHGYQSRAAWSRACEWLRKAIRAFLHRHGPVAAAPPAPAPPSALDMVDAVETQLLNNGALAQACSAIEPGWMALVPNVSPAGRIAPLTRAPALIQGKVFLPMLATPSGKAVVQGRHIEEGESFWAYMVLPLQALLRHREFTVGHHLLERPSWDWRVPVLILVRGDLRTGQVAKIGCFQPRENLKDVLLVLRPNLTILPRLVIV